MRIGRKMLGYNLANDIFTLLKKYDERPVAEWTKEEWSDVIKTAGGFINKATKLDENGKKLYVDVINDVMEYLEAESRKGGEP